MSYVPTLWQNGDVITVEKLNKLENGAAEMFAKTIEVSSVTASELYNIFINTNKPLLGSEDGEIQGYISRAIYIESENKYYFPDISTELFSPNETIEYADVGR